MKTDIMVKAFFRLIALSALFLQVFSSALHAAKVEDQKARSVAVNWYRHYAPDSRKAAVISKVTEYKYHGQTSFYIYSFDKGGFVLVSANDAVTPVLGYGFDHSVPDSINNEAVKVWFDHYARQIDTAFVLDLQTDASISKWDQILSNNFQTLPGGSVGPLLLTTWNQGWPYNAYCPLSAYASGGHSYTGCVATAYGQILKYYNYPPKGTGSIHYTDLNGHEIFANFDSTYYNWNAMPSSLSPSDTNFHEIAELLYHCGTGSMSNYALTFTTGYYVEEPLLNFFDYAYSSLKYLYRSAFTQIQWDSVLVHELNIGRPVYYAGSGPYGGHAFVCDGYDQSGYFHFNVGWGGFANGYYYTNNLVFSGMSFKDNQFVLTGIKPNDGSNISHDSTFSVNSHMTSSLYFSALTKVKFNPGSTIKFDSGCILKIGGSVQAMGNSTQPVVFTAFDTATGWGGMKINSVYHMMSKEAEPDTISFDNTIISYSNNSGIEIKGSGGDANPLLIKKGVVFKKSKCLHNSGAGISATFTKLLVDSCQIANNGSGIGFSMGWLDIKNSSIQNNQSTAISYNNQSNFFSSGIATISNNVISNNGTQGVSGDAIGGIYILSPCVGSFIKNNTISYNIGNPGAFRAHGNVIVSKNDIYGNVATFYGGGGWVADGAMVMNNKIFNNFAPYGGGGLAVVNGKIVNNLIYNNSSGIGGAASVNAIITNNTIVNNGSGISFIAFGEMKIKNNILWNAGLEINAGTNKINVSRSIIKGGVANINSIPSESTIEKIINRPPGFVLPTSFIGTGAMPDSVNWELNLASPAIDAAIDDTSEQELPGMDTYGFDRFNRTLDIGALENQSDTVVPCFIEDGYVIDECAGLANQIGLSIPHRGDNCQYAWYHNDSINMGINNDTLFINSLSIADTGKYYCIASNQFGRDTSDYIRINVFLTPPASSSNIYGRDTIRHFEKDLTYWTHPIRNSTQSDWIASQGLSFIRINDTIITLKVDDTITSGFIKFFGRNPCGTSSDTAVLHLTVLPMPELLTIYGDSSLCAGSSYVYYLNLYTTIFNFQYDRIEWQIPSEMDSYIWPAYGQMAIIYVDSLANSDTVYARWVKDNYGAGQWSPFPIRIFPPSLEISGAIMGPDSVALGSLTTFHVNHNPDVSSYEWIVPAGFNVISGQASESIMVFVDSTAQPGVIKVKAKNECRESSYVTDSVFISILPQQLCVAEDTVCVDKSRCYNATQVITVAGSCNTFLIQTGGSAVMIAGQSIKYLPNTTVKYGGYMLGYIAPTGPWCSTPTMPAVITGQDQLVTGIEKQSFKIYPNPIVGTFILEFKIANPDKMVSVDIYGIWGEKIFAETLYMEREHEFSLSGKPEGVYFIRVTTGGKTETAKIIKQ